MNTNRFEQTQIWQKTLAKQLDDEFEKERELLRVTYDNFRDKAKTLAGEIQRDLPEYTVHDINHIDALWDSAELVTKGDFDLNPSEAFVLGGAFLIHDLGMGLAAFPNGIEELKKEVIWKDTVVSLYRKQFNRQPNPEEIENPIDDILKVVKETVLRLSHAKHAEKLAFVSWKHKNTQEHFLIENNEIREAFGNYIGLIAHSHWWSIDELENRLKRLGAPGFLPASWTVDCVKLACILRVSDAVQIDQRRAPSFLRAIRKPSSISDLHWNFQQKLYQPRIEGNRIIYTSNSPFKIDEVSSWWLCYDTLKSVDKELKDVDSLLSDTNRHRLIATGITAIDDIEKLSKLISVEGWHPVDVKIRVSNIAKLVSTLGGEQLYGNDMLVPLRELIQNASDAIRARRIIENEDETYGDIIIRYGEDNTGRFLEVEDNGIGMSKRVLTGPFLDFGNSFWNTPIMHEELPGLEAKGYKSTGKYGIGFFSVFMLGQKVQVISRRYEESRENTFVIEFNDGSYSRPILRKATNLEQIKNGGTKIKIWISNDDFHSFLQLYYGDEKGKFDFKIIIERLCPSIDSNIYFEDSKSKSIVIKSNDWLTISPVSLIKRVLRFYSINGVNKDKELLKKISSNLKYLYDKEGNIVGRALVFHGSLEDGNYGISSGIITIGGLASARLEGIVGILLGESTRASRDAAIPIIENVELQKWINEQVDLLHKLSISNLTELECSCIIRSLGANTKLLKIVKYKNEYLCYHELIEIIKSENLTEIILVQENKIEKEELKYKKNIELRNNVFIIKIGYYGIINSNDKGFDSDWPILKPKTKKRWWDEKTLLGLLVEAMAECSNCDIDTILKLSDYYNNKKEIKATVGLIGENPIELDRIDIIKRPVTC